MSCRAGKKQSGWITVRKSQRPNLLEEQRKLKEDLISELYAAYYQELQKYLVNHIFDYAAAEDITQETFLRALEHEESLCGLEQRQHRAWLYRTAKNLLIDRIRHQSREPELHETGITETDLTEIEVHQLCSILSERDKSIFYLRHFEGYQATEIADIFQMTPENVRARLSLARKILKKELKK